MQSKITKTDVFLYFANKLDRPRRRELELAARSDEQVQRWFDELTPSEEDLRRQPVPEVRLDPAAQRGLAALAYRSVERAERAEQVSRWAEWMRGSGTTACPSEIVPSELLEGNHGAILYREPAAMTLGAQHASFSVPPPDVPCIHPDRVTGRLVIRQALAATPGGVVEVHVVRRREDQVERFPPVRISLEQVEPPEGEPYWYADVSLKSLIGDFDPGDDFIYCIAAASGT